MEKANAGIHRPGTRVPSVASGFRAARAAANGRLPPRYAGTWRDTFDARMHARLRPGLRILDVGAGSAPALPPGLRPAGCRYVGLDIVGAELEAAPDGGYDEWVVADARDRVPSLEERFDLVLSFQVLEHVKPLAAAVENMRAYLVPGGHLVAQLSGSFSVSGIANQLVPRPVALWLLRRLLDRPSETVFPAYYDHCWEGALKRMLAPWSSAEVVPEWWRAGYFAFSPTLRAACIGYEEWARLARRVNLAPYYVLDAAR